MVLIAGTYFNAKRGILEWNTPSVYGKNVLAVSALDYEAYLCTGHAVTPAQKISRNFT